MANFNPLSRYATGIVATNRKNKNFLTLRKSLNLTESSGDVFITVTADLINRPDLIAAKAYGDSQLWWVICEFNAIRDPFFDIKMGTILRIPEINRVLLAIEALES